MLLRSFLRALAQRTVQSPATKAEATPSGFSGPIVRADPLVRDPRLVRAAGEADEIEAFLTLPVTQQLSQIEAELRSLPDHEQLLIMEVLRKELDKPWLPLPGPQSAALNSEADVLLYGGAAGGGKTDLALGLAITSHRRSVICRREYGDLQAARERAIEIVGTRTGYNGQDDIFTLKDGRVIEFFAAKNPGDERKQQGQPKDLLVIDEAAHWLRPMVRYLMGWVRTTVPGQRTRVLLCSNPPTQYESDGDGGQWLKEMFAPWIDPGFPDRAAPGELRWVISDEDGKDRWVEGPGEYQVGGLPEPVRASSRSFIPAKIDDNPFLVRTDYKTALQGLEEPLRSAMLLGDWHASSIDNAWQVIPTAWIEAAQARWRPEPPGPMTCLGVDVAYGGSDEMIMAPRHGDWFGMPIAHRGLDTKNGHLVAGMVFGAMRDSCQVVVDLGGGWGSEAYRHLGEQEIAVQGFLGIEASAATARDGKRGFLNRRAEVWWKLREALDPAVGSRIALPPDDKLKADLTTPRWKPVKAGIQIEGKDEIRKRLGRSPDRGDAVTMAFAHGGARAMERAAEQRAASTAVVGYASAKKHHGSRPMAGPQVHRGYAGAKRRG